MTEKQVKEAIEVIKQYMKEHNLVSHQYKDHANVFFKELNTYMKLKEIERKTNA